MTHEVESIGPDDWELFRDVRLRSLAEAPEAFGSTYDDWVEASEQRWRDRLSAVPLTVVARQDDRVLGVASGAPDGDRVELISMWTDPEVRGTGVTAALIEAVVAWADQRGSATYLMVRSGNARAMAAYAKAGFVDRGVPADWPAGVPRENLMERPR